MKKLESLFPLSHINGQPLQSPVQESRALEGQTRKVRILRNRGLNERSLRSGGQSPIPAACLLSFAIPFLVMLGIFIINGVYPFGDGSFMHSDMYHQYVPFLSEMLEKLREGDSLAYSWNVGVGSNFTALYAYYMASPFNWLAVLFPDQYLIEFMSYLVVVKVGFCGFAFCWYLTKHFATRSLLTVPFAVFYALSGYLAAYNWNVMWLDCIFLFPFIALGLEALVKEGKYKLYCISLALCILSNYYISIMVCIFLVLYFILLLVCSAPSARRALAACGRFALFSALAGGMAAVLLIPEFAALHLTKFSEFDFPSKLTVYFSVLDMLARHCVNVAVETGLDHWPNIFCGTAVFLLVPLYLASPRIPLREKVCRAGLLAFLLVSFSTNMLNFIWHGMNYPDSLPARQSFLYIFLLLTLCAEGALRIRDCSFKALGAAFCFSLGLVLFFEKFYSGEEAYPTETFFLTALLLCIYAALLYCYRKYTDRTALRLLAVSLLLVVTAEAAVNTYSTSCSTTSRSRYLASHDSYTALVERTRQRDPDFYRFEKSSRVTKNDGTLLSYPTASLFSSTANGNVQAFYDKMGMSHSKVFYCFDGATPLSSSLLSVRYLFSKSPDEDPDLYTLVDQEGDVYLYECRYRLPVGFLVDVEKEAFAAGASNGSQNAWDDSQDIWDDSQDAPGSGDPLSASEGGESVMEAFDAFLGNVQDTRTDVLEQALEYEGGSPLETQNQMVRALGIKAPLFLDVSTQADGSFTDVPVEETGHYYAYVGNTKVDTLKMESEAGSKTFTKLKYHYICDLGPHEAGDVISLSSEDSDSLDVSVYRLDTGVMDQVIGLLGRETLQVTAFTSTSLEGTIRTEQGGELILSIPYEPGWTVWVDGKETEAGLFDDTFISVFLEPGEHAVSMRYRPAGLSLGIGVSLLCLAVFAAILLLERRRKS